MDKIEKPQVTKIDIIKSHSDGIGSELRNFCDTIQLIDGGKISKNDREHSLEMAGDYISHVINRLALILERLPELYIADDARPALDELGKRVESEEPGEEDDAEEEAGRIIGDQVKTQN